LVLGKLGTDLAVPTVSPAYVVDQTAVERRREMELGQLSRRGFVSKSLGALGGFSLLAGFAPRARAHSCSSWSSSNCCHRNYCCQPASCCEPVATCCAPAPTCCAPQPTCCAPQPTCCGNGHSGTSYEAAPPPEKEAPPAPGASRFRVRYYGVQPRVASRRSRYATLSMLER
jgi:hypothetical protein